MSNIRKIILILSLIVFVTSLVLLLNFTAPNPTGRRYSSSQVVINGSSNAIGKSGEEVLARDLGVEKNNANFDGTIPDFVTRFYVIESKNCEELPCESRGQFERQVKLALNTGRPLWIFMRLKTEIRDETMITRVNETGGAIVPYFAPPGYIDPVDMAAWAGLAAGAGVSAIFGVWELRERGISINALNQKAKQMSNENRNRIIVAVVIIVAIAVLLNTGVFRAGLSTLETVTAIAFYGLGAIWFFKHL